MPFDCPPHAGGLNAPDVAHTLDRLHRDARRDRWVFVRALPAIIAGRFRGRSTFDSAEPYLKDAYIPVSPKFGELMYLTARARKAVNIVEFGSSFGISSIYLAAAARENGGRFTGTEKDPAKAQIAIANLAEAGLNPVITTGFAFSTPIANVAAERHLPLRITVHRFGFHEDVADVG